MTDRIYEKRVSRFINHFFKFVVKKDTLKNYATAALYVKAHFPEGF